MTTVAVAGATGNLGGRMVKALLAEGADVWALSRPQANGETLEALEAMGAKVIKVDLEDRDALVAALRGAEVVVSALNGVRPVIIETQTALLQAAVAAGVRRFMPSDFAADFTRTADEPNRNFDLRREFAAVVDAAPIQAVSVLNGMFMDLLAYGTPLLDVGKHSVTYWGEPTQPLDFTTMDDTAAVTAKAALMPEASRYVRVAGDTLTPQGLSDVGSDVMGEPFSLNRAGSIADLGAAIERVQASDPGQPDEEFPRWQQMQYVRNMASGKAKLDPLDNHRFPGMQWTRVRDLLTHMVAQKRS